MKAVEVLKDRFYDSCAGWRDGTAQYPTMVFRHVHRDSRVLDIGSGTGRGFAHPLKGTVKEVVGLDPDKGVLSNPAIDRGVIGRAEDMPFPDCSFDVAVSSLTLEHIEAPVLAAREIWRVLRPQGHFIFRTPNLWHYTTLISRLTPYWFHRLVANRARALPQQAGHPCPTRYRSNTVSTLRRAFTEAGFTVVSLSTIEPEPSYLQFSSLLFLLGVAYERLVNSNGLFAAFRVTILGVFKKATRQPLQ